MGIWSWGRGKKDDDIILDCYTYNVYAYNFAKINHGYHYIPEWWKKTPTITENSTRTIKKCPAVIEYYKKGIVLPMWCEVKIQVNPIGDKELCRWESSQKDFQIVTHAQEQFDGFTKNNGNNLKILSPWFIKCEEEIYFTYTQPIWSQRDTMFNLILTPGVLSFKHQMWTSLNYFIEQKDVQQNIHIEPLTPMLIMHPMSERKIKLRHHLLTTKDRALEHPTYGMFINDQTTDHFKRKKSLFEKIDKIDRGVYK